MIGFHGAANLNKLCLKRLLFDQFNQIPINMQSNCERCKEIMTWTTPRTWQPGELVTAALLNEQLRDNLQTLYDQRNMGVRVYRNSNQSIPTNTYTPISFTNALYDPQSLFSLSTPTRLTVILAGVYLITGHCQWSSTQAVRVAQLRLNGITPIASQSAVNSGLSVSATLSVSTLYALDVGDYVELLAYHEAGGNLNVLNADYLSPHLAIQWVGVAS